MATKNYEDWPSRTIPLTKLLLDPENPRLRSPSPENEQRPICRELIEHENVDRLAREISQKGYYPTEVLIVVSAPGNKYHVLEGNRRVAALKCLTNPQFAPNEKKNRFEAMRQDGAGRIPQGIRAVVAPSRVAARPIILSRHTKASIEKWSPLSQARYIETMVQEGFSAEAMARDMGVDPKEFSRRFRDAKLAILVASMELPHEIRAIVEDPSKFKWTNLQRVVESANARSWLGIEADDVHGWVVKSNTADFRKAFTEIVIDVAKGEKANSRQLHKANDVEKYLKSLESPKPKPRGGNPVPATTLAGKTPPPTSPPGASKPPRTTLVPPKSLLPDDVVCDLDPPRIHSIIKELDKKSIRSSPNASAMLYRALVDMLLAEYFDTSGKTKGLRQKVDKRGQKPADWMPSLDQMIRYLVKDTDLSELNLPASAIRALPKFVDDKQSSISLEGLNGFAHNRYEIPDREQLEKIASRLRPLVAVLMQKPS